MFARDALSLLDALRWSKCHVVGLSFGGMVAQEVVKAVSKKGRPMAAQTMANAFFFDAFDQRGTYATVTPAL